MRWRLGVSLLTVLTATIAVGTAVLGPLFLRTAGDSVVRRTVSSAAIENRGVTLSAYQGQASSYGEVQRAERLIDQIGSGRWYGAPITSVLSGVKLTGPGQSPLSSQLFARTGICRQLRFERGGCDLGAGDVIVSDRSARELRVSVGSTISASVIGRMTPLRLKITGVYAVPPLTLSYWWGEGQGDFPFGQTTGPFHIPEIDPLIASAASALAVPRRDVPEVVGQVPLRPGAADLSDESSLEKALSAARGRITGQGGLQLSTMLPALLAGADHQRHVMGTIVAIAAVELVLLAVWVLGSLLVRSSDARRAEARVARLRGFTTASLLWVTVAEPAALCLVGIVIGVALALGLIAVIRAQLLVSAATIGFDGWAVVALGLTVLAIVGALGFGVVRLLRASGLSGQTAGARAGASVLSVVADSVLVMLGIVALVGLGTSGTLGGHTDPIASAAPGLIALAIAVLTVRIILAACRLGIVASADSRWLASFLALRQTARRPALLRQARVLIIALGLACFATSAWSVARANRTTVARFAVGTSVVATVAPRSPADLERAVDRIDPGGRFAMAAVVLSTPSSTLLGVDAPRLASVASWPQGISKPTVSAVGRALDPPTAPPVQLPAAPVAVDLSTAGTSLTPGALRDLDLALWVSSPTAGTSIIDFGRLRPGATSYHADLDRACGGGGCRLAGLGAVPVIGRPLLSRGTVDLTLERISAAGATSGRPQVIPADLSAGEWRTAAAGVRVEPSVSRGLTFAIPAPITGSYVDASGGVTPPMVTPADHPVDLPAAVTTELESLNPGGSSSLPAQGLDGSTISVTPTVTTAALPRVGGNGVMVDLGLLVRAQANPTSNEANDEVWLGPAAPTDALDRLRAAGLRIESVQRASSVLTEMQHTGPALADDFLLVATLAALLAAAAGTLGVLGATVRERATELVSLEVAGVPRRVLIRSLAVESVILAATALCGAGAGILAAVLAVPSLPELAAIPLIPLRYALPAGAIAEVSAVVVIVIVIASVGATLGVLHRMSPMLLRAAPDDAVS